MSTENSISNLFLFRSSHRKCSMKNVVLKIFPILTGKHLCWSQLLINIKRWLQHKCFLVNIARFLKTLILKNICELHVVTLKTLSGVIPWYVLALECLFHFIVCVVSYIIFLFLLLLFVGSTPSWSREVIFSVFTTNECSCL